MTFDAQSLMAYILVFCRMGGMVFFNPLLMRKELPALVRIGIAAGLTLVITPGVAEGAPAALADLALVFELTKELFVGIVCGMIFQIYYYLLFFIGDIMDTEFGLSMAKVFDPSTSIQMSISGGLLQFVFALYLFATDSHLLMIRIFASSYDIVPLGQIFVTEAAAGFVLDQFMLAFSLVIRLGLPFIAASLVMQVAMGVLMKLIPQINVFVLNIQMKIFLGLFMLFLFAGSIGVFVNNYTEKMFEAMSEALYFLRPPG